ncbi:MAG: GH116 family glycosyl hydrolase [Bacteroidales bacterium]
MTKASCAHVLLTCFLYLLAMNGTSSMADTPVIGFLGLDPDENHKQELRAAYHGLKGLGYETDKLRLRKLAEDPSGLKNYDIVWIHRPGNPDFTDMEKEHRWVRGMLEYVESGGKVILCMGAAKYLNLTGVEKNALATRSKEASDNGYGRMLGLHAFREHPVFDGLHGGAYILKPREDIEVYQTGYFGDEVPGKGHVVAVDWDYIFLRERTKLMFEYSVGKGKILAIGAYMLYDVPNTNRVHLEKFTRNCIAYLDRGQINKAFYWVYSEPVVQQKEFMHRKSIDIPPPLAWKDPNTSNTLVRGKATDNYLDLAGQRLLITGRETGGIDEVWAHPFMALRDYELGISFSHLDSVFWINQEYPRIEVSPGAVRRTYKFSRAYLTEIITCSPEEPVAVMHYDYRGVYPAELFIRFKSNLRIMWPYSHQATGSIEHQWDETNNLFRIADGSGDHNALLGMNKEPVDVRAGQYKTIEADSGMSCTGTDMLQLTAMARFSLNMNDTMDVVLAAGRNPYDELFPLYVRTIHDPRRVYRNAGRYHARFRDAHLKVVSPDPRFNQAFTLAMMATDQCFVKTPGLGTSLVAGYATTSHGWDGGHAVNGRPGYSWYFGRDGQWSGMAVLGYGDFDGVKDVLRLYQDFQDLNGKIFHELSTSGFVHYDASDATPLYVVLAGRYLKHSGDTTFIMDSWEHIERAMEYCYSTDTDEDGLIENTNAGHGWVEGGHLFGSHSSLYLTSCWLEALENAAYMAGSTGKTDLAHTYGRDARRVKKLLIRKFWNRKNRFFRHGMLKDGSFIGSRTIMPAIPMLFRQVDTTCTTHMLKVFSSDDFSSDWGTRIVGRSHPAFNPSGYHTGSVWPLFTGWASLAEYAYGRGIQGFTHLHGTLNVYDDWSLGYIEEVLHGTEYKPSGVCFHQCWSEAMALQPVIEGMLGFRPDAVNGKVALAPFLPAHWDSLRVQNIRTGELYLDLEFTRDSARYIYKITGSSGKAVHVFFRPVLPPGTQILDVILNGRPADHTIHTFPQGIRIDTELSTEHSNTLEIFYTGGISVVPVNPRLKAGYPSDGLRIISSQLNDAVYEITLEGKNGETYALPLWMRNNNIDRITQAETGAGTGPLKELSVAFKGTEEGYSRKTILIRLK